MVIGSVFVFMIHNSTIKPSWNKSLGYKLMHSSNISYTLLCEIYHLITFTVKGLF